MRFGNIYNLFTDGIWSENWYTKLIGDCEALRAENQDLFTGYRKVRDFRNKSNPNISVMLYEAEERSKIPKLESVDITGFLEFRNRLQN